MELNIWRKPIGVCHLPWFQAWVDTIPLTTIIFQGIGFPTPEKKRLEQFPLTKIVHIQNDYVSRVNYIMKNNYTLVVGEIYNNQR